MEPAFWFFQPGCGIFGTVCLVLPKSPFPCLQMMLTVFPVQIANYMELGVCNIWSGRRQWHPTPVLLPANPMYGGAYVRQETRVDPGVGKYLWRREWQSTLVLLPGEFHGQRSLVGCSTWDHKTVGHDLATKQQQIQSVVLHQFCDSPAPTECLIIQSSSDT